MNKKVKLLIITQKVDINDDILGFFHRWIEEFAKNCGKVTVICLYEGEHNLPENVKVLSLGKEKYFRKRCDLKGGACDGGRSFLEEKIFLKLKYTLNFYKYIWSERKNYDSVFVHMNPVYVVLGGIFWRMLGKKISIWYTHKNVDLKLRIAEKLTHRIFSASKESFRLSSKKLLITGHGIDVEKFNRKENISSQNIFTIVTTGRISPTKNILTIVKIIEGLKKRKVNCKGVIIGSVGTKEEESYYKKIQEYIIDNNLENSIKLTGAVSHDNIVNYLHKSDLFINLSDTGSLDKAVLEAMAVGLPVVSSNIAFKDVLNNHGLFLESKDVESVVRLISDIYKNITYKNGIFVSYVQKNHSIGNVVELIVKLT